MLNVLFHFHLVLIAQKWKRPLKEQIRDQIKIKKILWRKYIRDKNTANWLKYTKQRNKVNASLPDKCPLGHADRQGRIMVDAINAAALAHSWNWPDENRREFSGSSPNYVDRLVDRDGHET